MKLRKIFAGVAAVATLLGGMAFGATAANAEGNTATITVTGGTRGGVLDAHTFEYVELASYVKDNTTEIKTVADRAAVVAAIKEATTKEVPAGVDPLVWAQSGELNGTGAPLFGDNSDHPWSGNDASRIFADELVESLTTRPAPATVNNTLKLSGLDSGLYLLVDVTDPAENNSMPIIVGTKNSAFDYTGEVVVKNQTLPAPVKDVDDSSAAGKDDTVSKGDIVTYKVTSEIPATAGYNSYKFTFKDIPGVGLTVDKTTGEFKVNGVAIAAGQLAGDFDSTSGELVGNGTRAFTVTLDKTQLIAAGAAGEPLVLTYKALVNDQAPTTVHNEASVKNNDDVETEPGIKDLYDNEFSFMKVFADGSEVKNAQFTLYNEAGTTPIQRNGSDYVVTSAPTTGLVAFDGLADGTYMVKETKVAEGAQNVTGSFQVKLTWNKTTKKTTVELIDTIGMDPLNLVKYADNVITVVNIKSITELPLTGAAGIAMFTVIGMLIAGAAVTVFVKSRSTKRALNA
jgi:fimbrial isopeptide formation D2 family protein/LPXTG-motif cell wall-anchored protein